MRATRPVVLLCCAMLLSVHASPADSQAPAPSPADPTVSVPTVEAGWTLTQLLSSNAAVPDMPGLHVLNIEKIWVQGDEIVFWAKVRSTPAAWALLSLKDGALRTILTEGEEVVSKYAAPAMTDKLHVHFSPSLHGATLVIPGKAFTYVTIFRGLSGRGSVYAWDGQSLKRLLAQGETVALDGIDHRIVSASAFKSGPDGMVLLQIMTDQPAKKIVYATYDGTTLTPLLTEDAPLPGLSDRKLWRLGCAPGKDTFLVGGPAIVTCAQMSVPRRQAAIYFITPGKVVELVPPTMLLTLVEALSRDQLLVLIDNRLHLFLDGKDIPVVMPFEKDANFVSCFTTGHLLGHDRALFFSSRTFKSKQGTMRRSDYYVFDQGSFARITPNKMLFGDVTETRLGGDFPGLLVQTEDFAAGTVESRGEKVDILSFLVPEDHPLELKMIRLYAGGREVSLSDIVDWRREHEAVVRFGNELYLMKHAVPTPTP